MSAVGHTFEQLLTLCGWTKQHSSSSLEKHIASSFLETNEAVPQCHHRLLTAQFLCSVSPHAAWWIQQLMEALEKNLVNYINHQAQKRVVVVVKFGNVCNCNFFLSFFFYHFFQRRWEKLSFTTTDSTCSGQEATPSYGWPTCSMMLDTSVVHHQLASRRSGCRWTWLWLHNTIWVYFSSSYILFVLACSGQALQPHHQHSRLFSSGIAFWLGSWHGAMMADGMPISKDKRIVMMLACFLWTIVKRDGIKRVFVSLLFLFFLLCVWLSLYHPGKLYR